MNPADIRTQLREAVRLHRAGDTDAARNIIRGVLREHPDNADAWYAASMIATGAAQRKKMLERALEHNPD
ncbi:MAG: tetratricopeptide repeat protein, partial [Chloroflexota bacterium]